MRFILQSIGNIKTSFSGISCCTQDTKENACARRIFVSIPFSAPTGTAAKVPVVSALPVLILAARTRSRGIRG